MKKDLLIVLAAVVIAFPLVFIPTKIMLLIIFGTIYISVGLLDIKKGVLLTLLIRSSLDIINFSLSIGGLNLKISSVFGIFVILLLFISIIKRKIIIPNNRVIRIFLLYIYVMLMSLVLSQNIGGIDEWIKYISLLSMYILAYEFSMQDQIYGMKIIKIIIFSSVMPLTFGLYQIITNRLYVGPEGFGRVNSTFVHPNQFAFYIIIVIICCSIMLMTQKKKKLIIISILALSILELVLTYTRGAWVGLAIAFGIAIIRMKYKGKYKFAPLIIAAILIFGNTILDRFSGIFSSQKEVSSLATRLYIWKNMIAEAIKSPFFGHGLGSFTDYSNMILKWKIEAHNDYLKIFFETGIVGLIVFILLMLSIIKNLKSKNNLIITFTFSIFLAFILMSFIDNIIDNLVSQWYLWALVGVSSAINHNNANISNKT